MLRDKAAAWGQWCTTRISRWPPVPYGPQSPWRGARIGDHEPHHAVGRRRRGNRRITVGGHVRPLDDLTHRAVLDWLDHRRNRWPNTANPHLLITQKTAVELGPAGKLRTTRATRNLTATLERLRVDRQLEEALTHGADPLHLALVLGIDEKTAIRYADAARALPGEAAEQATHETHSTLPSH
ncbi:hypothetical protein QFZ56_007820 [Streptomyces achromogenes]|uniref:Integrase n=1 Tax=Streptomyces achromogenes TaxID=67255 RepID=A0ABU0QDX0_STRAH|nr:hypothetical protein [Streptomyces achromogenes]MDQ0688857.1 hypothetical protein [Streptomyces achromogenes]